MSRRGKADEPPPRVVQTLAGPVHYKDSGWTAAEWSLIQSAMARCTGVENNGRRRSSDPAPKPARRHGRHTPSISPISDQLRALADDLDRRLGDPMA